MQDVCDVCAVCVCVLGESHQTCKRNRITTFEIQPRYFNRCANYLACVRNLSETVWLCWTRSLGGCFPNSPGCAAPLLTCVLLAAYQPYIHIHIHRCSPSQFLLSKSQLPANWCWTCPPTRASPTAWEGHSSMSCPQLRYASAPTWYPRKNLVAIPHTHIHSYTLCAQWCSWETAGC